jgi:hypothetical protein
MNDGQDQLLTADMSAMAWHLQQVCVSKLLLPAQWLRNLLERQCCPKTASIMLPFWSVQRHGGVCGPLTSSAPLTCDNQHPQRRGCLPLICIGMADAVEKAPQEAGGIERCPVRASDVLRTPDEPLSAQPGAQLPQRPIVVVHLPAAETLLTLGKSTAVSCIVQWRRRQVLELPVHRSQHPGKPLARQPPCTDVICM